MSVWSYCLMPNHVHLIMTPATTEGLSRAGITVTPYQNQCTRRGDRSDSAISQRLFKDLKSSESLETPQKLPETPMCDVSPTRTRLSGRSQRAMTHSGRASFPCQMRLTVRIWSSMK
ncbi:MAG: hypothetical protein VX836_04565 [Pseudomonadota bacterium]|nr:hypothetical protein [Pseudomonadota bacterium]